MKTIYCIFIVTFTIHVSLAQKWTNFPIQSPVNSIAFDSSNNLWVGTASGVLKLNENTLTPILDATYVRTIEIDKKGNVWVGSDMSGVYKYDGKNWIQYTSDNGLAFNIVTTIAFDLLGNNWIGTADVMGRRDGGISKFDGTTWKNYTTKDGLVNNLVWDIAIDNKENKWVGTSNGLSKFDGTTWTTYDISYLASNGVGSNYLSKDVWSIFIDKFDNIWVGTLGGGAFKYDGNKWTSFGQLDGLHVSDIVMDREGKMWFGTDNGAFKFDGTTWTNCTTADGLIDNTVCSIAIDLQNNKWFATNKGLSKLSDTPVGISSNTISDFSIFPNPASNSITIDLPNSSSQTVSVSIKDLNGIEVKKETLNLTKTRKIDVSRLINGTYYLTINSDDIKSTQRLVITR